MLRAFGVTGPRRMVNHHIAARQGATAGRVAAAARMHPGSLSGILGRRVRAGLVVRARHALDARTARFVVTSAGETVRQLRFGTVEAALARARDAFTADERAVMQRWLRAFGDEREREREGMSSVPGSRPGSITTPGTR